MRKVIPYYGTEISLVLEESNVLELMTDTFGAKLLTHIYSAYILQTQFSF